VSASERVASVFGESEESNLQLPSLLLQEALRASAAVMLICFFESDDAQGMYRFVRNQAA
jgi:hypothetical protein